MNLRLTNPNQNEFEGQPMKNITIIIALLITTGTQAVAVETKMVCDSREGDNRYYKHVSPFFGRPSVQQKINGQWGDWCRPFDGYIKPCEFEIFNNKAEITEYFEVQAIKNIPSLGLVLGDKILKIKTLVIDFKAAKRISKQIYFKQSNGSEIVDWRDGVEYSCEIQSK